MLTSKQVLTLIDQVGSNAYAADVSEDGAKVTIEVTAAQATKLQELLGAKNVKVSGLKGSHILVMVDLATLQAAAAENKRTSRGSAVNVAIESSVIYTVNAPDATNEVTAARWSSAALSGSITVNGVDYEIAPGRAEDFYSAPEDSESEWNPERTVYVVDLPTTDSDGEKVTLTLVSYGVTNLIRRVASRNEQIG